MKTKLDINQKAGLQPGKVTGTTDMNLFATRF